MLMQVAKRCNAHQTEFPFEFFAKILTFYDRVKRILSEARTKSEIRSKFTRSRLSSK